MRALREDPHPLARLVADCGLARAESRGAHRRRDAPETDPALDSRHVVVAPAPSPRSSAEDWSRAPRVTP